MDAELNVENTKYFLQILLITSRQHLFSFIRNDICFVPMMLGEVIPFPASEVRPNSVQFSSVAQSCPTL